MIDLPRTVVDALEAVTYRDHAIAYLQISADFTVVGMGGALENYSLDEVRIGESAFEHAFFLEGVLPITEAPYLLPAIELAHGRCADLHFYLDRESTWLVLLDVTAERDQARRMQQKAYDVTLLEEREADLIRRLEATNADLRATQAELMASREALVRAHERLDMELADAGRYVRSLLPAPFNEPFAVDWRFTPCTELGGDAFGYHWIDSDHFVLYLLDVCGHGVGPCLMSIGVLHVLQSAALREVDFRDPKQVLDALNARYQMVGLADLFFTLWYGVYHPQTRRLDYACAGHPSAVLLEADAGEIRRLAIKSPPIGCKPGAAYPTATLTVPTASRLYLVSDGAYEIARPDGGMLSFDGFLEILRETASALPHDLDRLFERLTQLRGGEPLEDDCSMLRLAF
jgi:serine phosphatase RsbU (regulator of sigma subunit)